MNDQVSLLQKKGLKAISVVADARDNQSAVVRGDYQYIFTTPEILLCSKNWNNVFQSPSFQERLVGVVTDEAHCPEMVSAHATVSINDFFHSRGSDFCRRAKGILSSSCSYNGSYSHGFILNTEGGYQNAWDEETTYDSKVS